MGGVKGIRRGPGGGGGGRGGGGKRCGLVVLSDEELQLKITDIATD